VLAAGLDARGALGAWRHATSAPSILHQKSGSMFDPTTVEGLREVPYVGEGADAPAHALTYHRADLPTPLGFWRSVGHSQNALAIECFVDELAEAAAVDPVALRRRLLGARHARHLGVLDRAAAEVAALGAGDASRVWGWALHASFDSYVALAARCARDGERLRVEHVVAAVDCGRVVNPNVVRQQIEGGVCFGLSAALYGRVRIQGGAVVERGFHDHPVLRFDAAPTIDVHLVASEAPPTGVGEIAVPLIGPAVVNAWSRLLGRRVRSLPLFPSG
jgi:isoquinoline 1-oxidoreductase beta subunit